MATRVKWWEAVEEPTTVWRACVTEDGLDYYVNTETNQTSWDKPEELMTNEDTADQGDWRWCPDPDEVFVPGRFLKEKKGKVDVELRDGSRKIFKAEECKQKVNFNSLKRTVADLTLLDDMSSQLILHNLKRRFADGRIYTNIGTILISVNPYRSLDLYTDDVVKKYANRQPGIEMPPHVYNIAHDAYYGISAFKQLQSIVISGESGAGKTEATKRCLQYLATVAPSTSKVENKILMANPVLEALGNAKTLRNDNSSRFGKYIQVYFDDDFKISGCKIETYLLEKIRVSSPAPGERNFHAFYQLAIGADAALRSKLSLLARPVAYNMLSTCVDVPTIDDKKDFEEVMGAFKDLAFQKEHVDGILEVLASVMMLGNVEFKEGKPDEAQVAKDSRKHIGIVADLLKLDQIQLSHKLVTRDIVISGQETTTAVLNVQQASDNRYALCKFVYGRMFDWVVAGINRSFGNNVDSEIFGRADNFATDGTDLYIGILDIFGFEIFQLNSLEQLCINFTNEMLQQHFNNNTFKLEEKLYKAEGVDVPHIAFIDNQPMIELLTESKTGVLPMLDEELRIPGGSDKNFLFKLEEKQSKNSVYDRCPKLRNSFAVRHYAGSVTYDVAGFLDKNRDTLTTDLLELLQTSENPFIILLYPPDMVVTTAQRKHSLVHQFQKQLNDLMRQLYQTQPHYIRCVKPNNDKKPLEMVPRNCFDQLTYSGVFEAVAIRKQGFPFRLSHEDFVGRYKKICPEEIPDSTPVRDAAKSIVKQTGLDQNNVRVGNSKMLYRAIEYRKLELDWSIVTKNQKILDDLERLCAIDVTGMDRDEKDAYIVELASAVRESDLFRIHSAVAVKGRKLLEGFIEERVPKEIKERLAIAKAEMNREDLEELMELCDEEGYIIKLTRECRELLEKIQDADAALNMAMAKMSEEFLERALDMCKEFSYAGTLVAQAVRLLKGIRKAKAAIEKAMRPPFKASLLLKAIQLCGQAGYVQSDTRYNECVDLHRKVEDIEKELEDAVDSWDQGKLERVLEKCDKHAYAGGPYRSPIEEECRESLKKVIFMNGVFKQAIERCVESQVLAAVKKGKELGIRSKQFNKLRKLAEGDYNDFLKLQYKRAKKCDEHARAIRVRLKMVDRIMQEKGGSLALKKYSGLKASMDWSAEKPAGFVGSKLIRASGMLSYQKDELHSPLTKAASGGAKPGVIATVHAKIFARKYFEMFQIVQQVMGQRDIGDDLPRRLNQLCLDLVKHQVMRDEAFIYIIKQTNGNPVSDTADPKKPIPRAFAMLVLLLMVVPPTKGFEGYLEYWLREHKFLDLKAKYNCKGLLRRRIYLGVDDQVPGIEDFEESVSHFEDGGPIFNNIIGPMIRLGDFEEPELDAQGNPVDGSDSVPNPSLQDYKRKSKVKLDWRSVVDPASQKTYYYNVRTNATQWECPQELVETDRKSVV